MILITNFKTYESALGEAGFNLAKTHALVRQKTGKDIQIAGHPLDLRILLELGIPVLSQGADLAEYGSFTGKILPIKLKKIGCKGTLLNHSENRIEDKVILEKIIKRCKELELETVVCAENVDEGIEINKMGADFVAVEPPELIGGDVSVSKANPEIIKQSVDRIGNNVIIGAGIKNSEDIKIAKDYGVAGILLASGVTKADNPEEVLMDLASAL